ncbi:MAG: anti-sigma factor antagonist [Clostridia bacterium]
MELFKRRSGSTLIITMRGELDHHSAQQARGEIDAMLSDSTVDTLSLDMRGITFMDSSGLGVVLGRYKMMNERKGKMRIVGASKCAERIMKMAGIYSLVEREV